MAGRHSSSRPLRLCLTPKSLPPPRPPPHTAVESGYFRADRVTRVLFPGAAIIMEGKTMGGKPQVASGRVASRCAMHTC